MFATIKQHTGGMFNYSLHQCQFNKTFAAHFPRKELAINIMQKLLFIAKEFDAVNKGIQLIGGVISRLKHEMRVEYERNLRSSHTFESIINNQQSIIKFICDCEQWFKKHILYSSDCIKNHSFTFISPFVPPDIHYAETGVDDHGDPCIRAKMIVADIDYVKNKV